MLFALRTMALFCLAALTASGAVAAPPFFEIVLLPPGGSGSVTGYDPSATSPCRPTGTATTPETILGRASSPSPDVDGGSVWESWGTTWERVDLVSDWRSWTYGASHDASGASHVAGTMQDLANFVPATPVYWYRSPGGSEYLDAFVLPVPDPGDPHPAWAEDLASDAFSSPGSLVIVGSFRRQSPYLHALVWVGTPPGSIDYVELPDFGPDKTSLGLTVARLASGDVVCGGYAKSESNDNMPAVWTSDDQGISWDLHVLPLTANADQGQVKELIAGSGDELFAVGDLNGLGWADHGAVWRSEDGGQTWTVEVLGHLSGYAQARALTAQLIDGELVVGGESYADSETAEFPQVGTLWVREGEDYSVYDVNTLHVDGSKVVETVTGIGGCTADEMLLAVNWKEGQSIGAGAMHSLGVTDVEPSASVPGVSLRALRNPFARGVEVAFTLEQPALVRLDVFDALGRRISSLSSGPHEAGEHRAYWDASERTDAEGVFFLRLEAGSRSLTTKVVRTR